MTEEQIIEGIRKRDLQAFEAVVNDYSEQLIIFAYLLLKDREKAVQTVDDILLKVFNQELQLSEPIHHFLNNQVRTACGY